MRVRGVATPHHVKWLGIGEKMDVISAVGNSIALLNQLNEISKKINNAELKNAIADLTNELADVKLAAADLKEQIATLKDENATLKHQKLPKEKPKIKWGCYYFDEDPSRLFCPGCYDSKGQKHLTSRATSNHRFCTVCRVAIGSG